MILWNTVPHHPHRPGEPMSNRRPSVAEVEIGAEFARRAIELLRPRRVVAVGRIAEGILGEGANYVRHPANGGGAAFAAGMAASWPSSTGAEPAGGRRCRAPCHARHTGATTAYRSLVEVVISHQDHADAVGRESGLFAGAGRPWSSRPAMSCSSEPGRPGTRARPAGAGSRCSARARAPAPLRDRASPAGADRVRPRRGIRPRRSPRTALRDPGTGRGRSRPGSGSTGSGGTGRSAPPGS